MTTISIAVVATNDDGSTRWESNTVYRNLDTQQELFIEKHLLAAFSNMNNEAQGHAAAGGPKK